MNGRVTWTTRPLKECGRLLTGGTPSRSEPRFWGGAVPWISAKSLKKFDVVDSEDRLTEAGANVSTLVPPGSVLFVVRGMSLANELRVGVSGRELAFNQDLRALVPCEEIEGRYLARFLQGASRQMLTLVDEASHGTKRLTSERFEKLQVPVPSLEEQRRIVKILDRTEVLLAKRRAAVTQLDALTQAIFLDMFGDPTANPKGWPEIRLVDGTKQIQIGPFGSLLHEEDYVIGGVPLINPKHIQEGRIVPDPTESVTPRKLADLELYRLRHGDVVMGRRGEMGRCAIVGSEHDGFVCGTGSLFLRPNVQKATALYLATSLSSSSVRRRLERLSLGATLPNLNRTIVEKLLIPLPPTTLQERFARRVASVETLKAAHRNALAEFDALFSSLQHRAFRGEL